MTELDRTWPNLVPRPPCLFRGWYEMGPHRSLTEAPQKTHRSPTEDPQFRWFSCDFENPNFRWFSCVFLTPDFWFWNPWFGGFSRDFEVFFNSSKTSQGLKRCYRFPWFLRQHSSRRFVEVWVATLQIRPRSLVNFARFWSYYKAISTPPFPPVFSPTPQSSS